MHSRLLPAILALGVAIGAAACASDDESANPTNPSSSITEVFEGTLPPNGARTHDFSVAASGTVRATMTRLTAESTITIGLTLGTWNGSTCTAVVSNDTAAQNAVVTATAGSAGRLCVRVYDAAGTLTETVEYSVTVVHP